MPLPLIYFIRHGLSVANQQAIIAGTLETELTPQGIAQAAESGVFLKTLGLRQIFCSPMHRTRQTLEALALKTILTQFEPRLHEIDCGIYEGKPFTAFPPEHKIDNLFRYQTIRRTGGESVNDMRARMRSFIDEKLVFSDKLNNSDNLNKLPGPVLIVGHAASGRALMLELTDSRLHEKLIAETIDNASVWKLENQTYERIFIPSQKTQFDA